MISLSSQAKMIYAYIRISTDKQIKENQRFEIEKFAESKGLKIDLWVSEQVTGTKSAKERRLGPLLRKMKKGDTVPITVYRNSKGQYKLEPGPTPVYFLAFAAMIPLGLIGCVVLSKDIIKYHREEKE